MTASGEARRHLLLFTEVFPHGRGEAFLEPEIGWLAEAFDLVTVVPRRTADGRRALPANVRVDDTLAARHRVRTRARSLARCLTSRHLHAELARRPRTLVQPAAADHLVGHLAAALRVADWMEEAIARGRVDPADTLAYCYWLWTEAAGLGLLRERGTHIPFVTRAHGFDVYPERHDPPYIPLQRFAIRNAERVFAVSEHGRRSLAVAHPREASRLTVARLGTDDPPGCASPSHDGVLRVVTCSRLEEVKRLTLAVHGLHALARQRPEQPVEWTHFGDGVEREAVQSLAERLLPPSVRWSFLGEVPNAVVREHYRTAPVDVLLNVSRSEGVPVSMMEAHSFGIPVVATAVGGVPEIVDPDTGVLLAPDPRPDDVASALLRFVSPTPDVMHVRAASHARWVERYRGADNFAAFVRSLLALGAESGHYEAGRRVRRPMG